MILENFLKEINNRYEHSIAYYHKESINDNLNKLLESRECVHINDVKKFILDNTEILFDNNKFKSNIILGLDTILNNESVTEFINSVMNPTIDFKKHQLLYSPRQTFKSLILELLYVYTKNVLHKNAIYISKCNYRRFDNLVDNNSVLDYSITYVFIDEFEYIISNSNINEYLNTENTIIYGVSTINDKFVYNENICIFFNITKINPYDILSKEYICKMYTLLNKNIDIFCREILLLRNPDESLKECVKEFMEKYISEQYE